MVYIPEISKSFNNGVYCYHEDWLDIPDSSKEYRAEVKKRIAYCKPDMYFNYLYRFIIRYEFEELGNTIPTMQELNRLYLEAALKILKERGRIMLSYDETYYTYEWRLEHKNISKELDDYRYVVFHWINFHTNIYDVIGLSRDENSYLSDNSVIFFQNVVLASFLIAYNRIVSEINNSELLGAEIIPFGNKTILNIYLTPFGMINIKGAHLSDKDKRLSYFNSFVASKGFNRIYDEERLLALNTTVILEKGGKTYCHFEIPFYNYANDFITDRLNKPHINSIFVESQASYECEE